MEDSAMFKAIKQKKILAEKERKDKYLKEMYRSSFIGGFKYGSAKEISFQMCNHFFGKV